MLNLTARIEPFGESGYLAYLSNMNGMVEMGETPEQAIQELIVSLKVLLAHLLKIELDGLKDSIVKPLQQYKIEQSDDFVKNG